MVYRNVIAKKMHLFIVGPFFAVVIFAVMVLVPIISQANSLLAGQSSVELFKGDAVLVEGGDEQVVSASNFGRGAALENGKLRGEGSDKLLPCGLSPVSVIPNCRVTVSQISDRKEADNSPSLDWYASNEDNKFYWFLPALLYAALSPLFERRTLYET